MKQPISAVLARLGVVAFAFAPTTHLSSAYAGEAELPSERVRSARQLIAAGQTSAAVATLREALADAPSMTEGWVLLGNALLGAEQTAQAIDAYRRALVLDPALKDTRYNLAYALRRVRRYDEAIRVYRAHLRTAPEDTDALFGLAESLKGVGRWVEAADALDAYIDVEKRPEQAKWVAAAKAESAELRAHAAAFAAPQAPSTVVEPQIEAPPNPIAAPSAGAEGSAKQRAAVAGAASTNTAGPSEPSARAAGPAEPAAAEAGTVERATVKGSAVESTKSFAAVDTRAQPMPSPRAPRRRRPAEFEQGLTLLRNGAFEQARGLLEIAAAKGDDDPVVLSALAGAYLGAGQADPALATYRRALAQRRTALEPALRFGMAEAHRLSGNHGEAMRLFDQVARDARASDGFRSMAQERLAALRSSGR